MWRLTPRSLIPRQGPQNRPGGGTGGGALSVRTYLPSSFWWVSNESALDQQYKDAKAWLEFKKLPPDVNPNAVFANSQLDLKEIAVYGFDYDYTLASYRTTVENYIHDEAKKALVDIFKYPDVIRDLEYEPSASIRGLHYDIEKGLLLKIDSINQIQFGTVYRGREKLENDEVLQIYKRRRLPQDYVDAHLKPGQARKMVQLVDIFAKPMICLLSSVIQWFLDNKVKFVPESVFVDVTDSINIAHPKFHLDVSRDPERFLEIDPDLKPWLASLRDNNKETFLITNSPFSLVNAGLIYMFGDDWRQFFDVIIVNAKKPSFFTHRLRHFRRFFPEEKILSWKHVNRLERGRIYSRGNINELQDLTGWEGDRVLYFGDHPYADLADLSLNHGWRTGAIIKEIEEEVSVMNLEQYKWGMNWATVLQILIDENQDRSSADDRKIIQDWQAELEDIRQELKCLSNPMFGSIFRTHQNSTYFSRRLFRFADIYTSKITNLKNYSLNHAFYPRRGALPHEFRTWFM